MLWFFGCWLQQAQGARRKDQYGFRVRVSGFREVKFNSRGLAEGTELVIWMQIEIHFTGLAEDRAGRGVFLVGIRKQIPRPRLRRGKARAGDGPPTAAMALTQRRKGEATKRPDPFGHATAHGCRPHMPDFSRFFVVCVH